MKDNKKNTLEKPDTWLQNYGDMLYRYALLRVRSESLAEDLVQETLLAGIKSCHQFAGKSSTGTWLTGILKHKIIDHFRKHRHEASPPMDQHNQEDYLNRQFDERDHWKINLIDWKAPDLQLQDRQFRETLQRCLAHLPAHMADLLIMRTLENVSSEMCCKILGYQSTNQMWVTLSRARMKLQHCLNKQWFEKN